MEHPLFSAIEEFPEKPPRYLRVDKTYPEWTIGEKYEGTITFILVQQDLNGSLFEILNFVSSDEPVRTEAEKIAAEYKKEPKARPMIVPSPSE